MVHFRVGLNKVNRRDFLRFATAGTTVGLLTPSQLSLAADQLPNPVGYAVISWPDQDLPTALQAISSLGFQGVQLLDWVTNTYQGVRTAEFARQLAELKLQPVLLSAHRISLTDEHHEDEVARLHADAAFLQKLGGRCLQISDNGEPKRAYPRDVILSFGERLNRLGKLAGDYGLQLGYHPHTGTIGQTREGLGQIMEATDPARVKLIADVGHLLLGGSDPAEVIRTYHERLVAMHFKDVRRDTLELARREGKSYPSKFLFCEIGKGEVNFTGIVDAIREVRYEGWIIIELDAYEHRPGGPQTSAEMNRDAMRRLGFRI